MWKLINLIVFYRNSAFKYFNVAKLMKKCLIFPWRSHCWAFCLFSSLLVLQILYQIMLDSGIIASLIFKGFWHIFETLWSIQDEAILSIKIGWKLFTIFVNSFILDFWQCAEYAFGIWNKNALHISKNWGLDRVK